MRGCSFSHSSLPSATQSRMVRSLARSLPRRQRLLHVRAVVSFEKQGEQWSCKMQVRQYPSSQLAPMPSRVARQVRRLPDKLHESEKWQSECLQIVCALREPACLSHVSHVTSVQRGRHSGHDVVRCWIPALVMSGLLSTVFDTGSCVKPRQPTS